MIELGIFDLSFCISSIGEMFKLFLVHIIKWKLVSQFDKVLSFTAKVPLTTHMDGIIVKNIHIFVHFIHIF